MFKKLAYSLFVALALTANALPAAGNPIIQAINQDSPEQLRQALGNLTLWKAKRLIGLEPEAVLNQAHYNNYRFHGEPRTPLCWTAYNRYSTACAQVLLEYGADINANIYTTALHEAVAQHNIPLIHLLIERGASIRIQNRHGITPAHVAARHGYTACLQALRNYTTLTGIIDNNGNTPLHTAAQYGHATCIAEARHFGPLYTTNGDGYTALHLAAQHGHAACVQALITAGANMNLACNGLTPLSLAARYGHIECVNRLIECGANVNLAYNGSTALSIALEHGQTACAERIRAAGGTISIATQQRLTDQLITAARTNNLVRLQELISAGADINAPNSNGWTALYVAAEHGQTAYVNRLIELGSDINRACNGFSPLFVAIEHDRTACAQALIAAGATIDARTQQFLTDQLITAAQTGNLARLQELITLGANVDATNNDGETPLHWAAYSGHLPCVQELIAAGANISATNNNGETPLIVTTSFGHLNCVQTLIASGANVNATDNHGATPLHFAAEYGHIATVRELIAADANISAATTSGEFIGETPAANATRRGYRALARLLNDVQANGPQAATSIEKTDEDDCSICYEPFEEGSPCASLGCGHDFCPPCITQAADAQLNMYLPSTCPLCRAATEFTQQNREPQVIRTVCRPLLKRTCPGIGGNPTESIFVNPLDPNFTSPSPSFPGSSSSSSSSSSSAASSSSSREDWLAEMLAAGDLSDVAYQPIMALGDSPWNGSSSSSSSSRTSAKHSRNGNQINLDELD
ncbi:ankyrin repeat domain-containing protein [Candidatus Babeliales bacterium]|nr:ankyrin repeat domain-containing protein [Candidatus Babeliales bacterium]